MKSRSCSRGFTLIEIMVVVALIAILAAIALPAYNNYIARSKIKTAQADLVALSLNFENMYQRKLTYSPTGAVNTTSALETEFKGWNPASNSNDFTFSATMGTPASGYTVTATGAAGGVNGCAITLTNEGDKAIATCSYASSGKWL